ncbi:MAG: protein kinase [Polyangiaceae bacterium]
MTSAALARLLSRPSDRRRLGPFLVDDSRKLGEGGFAPVFLSDEVHAGVVLRTVALKIFTIDARTGPDGQLVEGPVSSSRRAQIVEEARALCRIEHPNVVRFYALPTDDELGLMGLAMEHVAGTSLEERLHKGPLSIDETLLVGESVASALFAVHSAGLVHRDVKPANIIESAGVYKLIDFGVAAAEAPAPRTAEPEPVLVGDFMIESPLTKAQSARGGFAGTLGYVDPECVRSGRPAGPRSDLYGLGATLYECLPGKLPAAAAAGEVFNKGESVRTSAFQAVLMGDRAPPSVAKLRPDAPRALVEMVDALLAPTAALRPRSGESVLLGVARVRAEVGGRKSRLPPESVGPFRGLGRFEESDQDVFFGRSAEIAATIELLRNRSFVTLVGASGSGKSSLARAGLIPAVRRGAVGPWPTRWRHLVLTPGREPYEAWTTAMVSAFGWASPPSSVDAAATAILEHPDATGEGVLLVVDQLEELVTTAAEASREQAVDLLVRVGSSGGPGIRVVAAARSDLLDALLALPDVRFGRLLSRGMQLVSPLTDAAWEDVLTHALEAYDYRFADDQVRSDLLDELRGTISAMPLVQFALTQLWGRRNQQKREIDRSALTAIGGIAGALDRHAEATFATIIREGSGNRARAVLLALTTPQGTRATRARSELGEDDDELASVLAKLTLARIVVEEPDGFTLAHEALLSQWTRMREWVEAVRADRQAAEEVERAAHAWRASGDDTLLWRKRRLASLEELMRAGLADLSDLVHHFAKASRAAERRARVLIGVAILLVAAGAAVGALFYVRRIREEQQRTRSALADLKRERDAAQLAREQAERRESEANDLRITAETANQREAAAKLDYERRFTQLRKELIEARTLDDFERVKRRKALDGEIDRPPTTLDKSRVDPATLGQPTSNPGVATESKIPDQPPF